MTETMEDIKQKTLVFASKNRSPVALKPTLEGVDKNLSSKKFNYYFCLVNIETGNNKNTTSYYSLLECTDPNIRPIFHAEVFDNISKTKISDLTSFPEKMFFLHERDVLFLQENLFLENVTDYIYKWEQSLIKN